MNLAYLGPFVVHGDDRGLTVRGRDDLACRDKAFVGLLQHLGQLLEGLGDNESSFPHGKVFGVSSLRVTVRHRTGVSELNLGCEHLGTSTNSPSDNGLGDLASLPGLDDTVFLNTTDFTKQDEHLASGISLVTEQVVDESGSWVAVTTNGDTLVNTVGSEGEDVVELVGHTTGLGDVSDASSAVELGGDDVVHHTTRVSDTETSRLDSTNSCRSNDHDLLLLCFPQDLTSVTLGNTLSDQSNGTNAAGLGRVVGKLLQDLHGRAEDGTGRSEVDDDINVGVLANSLSDGGVHGQEGLLGSPVEFLDVVSTEGVNHGSDGGSGTSAREVKVKHALNGTGLETIHKAASFSSEGKVPLAVSSGGGIEVDNIVPNIVALSVGPNGANVLVLGSLDSFDLLATERLGRSGSAGSSGGLNGLLCNAKCERNDLGDMGLGTEDVDGNTEMLSEETHGLETFLLSQKEVSETIRQHQS